MKNDPTPTKAPTCSIGCLSRHGFTLIELLIVVAIIAILAAIAVPNFLEAQTRSKVSRVVSDLRTTATALESYYIDNKDYPINDGDFSIMPIQMSTPISYLTTSKLTDPFTAKSFDPVGGTKIQIYSYFKIVTLNDVQRLAQDGAPLPPMESVDHPTLNDGAFQKYGKWKILSLGPDRTYAIPELLASDPILGGSDVPYDPTNGSVSTGNIIRTQKDPIFVKGEEN